MCDNIEEKKDLSKGLGRMEEENEILHKKIGILSDQLDWKEKKRIELD